MKRVSVICSSALSSARKHRRARPVNRKEQRSDAQERERLYEDPAKCYRPSPDEVAAPFESGTSFAEEKEDDYDEYELGNGDGEKPSSSSRTRASPSLHV